MRRQVDAQMSPDEWEFIQEELREPAEGPLFDHAQQVIGGIAQMSYYWHRGKYGNGGAGTFSYLCRDISLMFGSAMNEWMGDGEGFQDEDLEGLAAIRAAVANFQEAAKVLEDALDI